MKFGRTSSISLLVSLLGAGRTGEASAANFVEIVRDARWTISRFSPDRYIRSTTGSYVEFAWMKVMEFASTGGKTK